MLRRLGGGNEGGGGASHSEHGPEEEGRAGVFDR